MTAVAVSLLAAAVWAVLFLLPRPGFWRRALGAGLVLGAGAALLLDVIGELDDTMQGASAAEVLTGGLLAVVAYVGVRVGYPLTRRWFPAVTDAADDLFSLRTHGTALTVASSTIVLGVAEELVFRGIVQQQAGLGVAVAVYTGVQLVTGNWLVLLLGVVGGTVWGVMFLVTGSLIPGLLCHVLPIAAIAVAPPASVAARYPLRRRGDRSRPPGREAGA